MSKQRLLTRAGAVGLAGVVRPASAASAASAVMLAGALLMGLLPARVRAAVFDSGAVAFTAAQAARGRGIYDGNCASCHGAHLDDGQFGPPVSGPMFEAQWHNQTPQSLLTYLATKMPPSSPGGLDGQAYADVDAYILQQNGEQPGTTELASASIPAPAAGARGGGRNAGGGNILALFDNHDAAFKAAMARRQAELDRLTPVSDQMLGHPSPDDWLMWRGDYGALGYSALSQISRRNVGNLGVAWTLALPVSTNETSPLVHDGVLFVESANTIEALDGATGEQLWQYVRPLPDSLHGGRNEHVKAMAIYQDNLYAPTADGHVVALDVKSGRVIWDHDIAAPPGGTHAGAVGGGAYSVTGGPLVAHGKVIIGVSLAINTGGGDFIVALDARTGAEDWRFHTVSRPGFPGADSWNGAPVDQRYGGGVWTVGSYDPDLNLVYFGTGNTYDVGTLLMPRANNNDSNDALFTDSTLAIDPDTGKLAWYYQHFNGDVWDLDWVFEQSLLTLPIDGRPTKLLVTGGKLGIFDALDRANGKYEFSKDAGLQNLVTRIDPHTGKKYFDPKFTPIGGKTFFVCPSTQGARNWLATSFDPSTDILYVPMFETCMNYRWQPRPADQVAAGGNDIRDMTVPRADSDGKFGRIEAINLKTRKIVWTYRQRSGLISSLLASAGGVVFSGSHDRSFAAYDATSGKPLWRTMLSASPNSSPITYSVDGVQYVAVIAGRGFLDGSSGAMTPEIDSPANNTTLWVFKLRNQQSHSAD